MSRHNFKYIAFLAWGCFEVVAGVFFILASWGATLGVVFLLLGGWGIFATIAEMRRLNTRQVHLWYMFKGITFLVVGVLLLTIPIGSAPLLTAIGLLAAVYGAWRTFSSISQLRAMSRERR